MTQEKEVASNSEQLDKVLTDIDVLDNEETNVFRVDNDTFKLAGIEYKLIENYKEAFEIEMMENRFTDYLLKYDYIVGDISYEKLRLRGFFEDSRRSVPIDMKISNLEDYLVEYCSFGCQYFVFERVEKKEEDPEPYFKPRRSKRSRKSGRSNQQNKRKQGQKKQQQSNKSNKSNKNKSNQNKPKDFQVVKKENGPQSNKSTQNKDKKKNGQTKKKEKTQFKIRKKND